LGAELRGKTNDAQISYCSNLRSRPSQSIEHLVTVTALRSTARRIMTLRAGADDLEREITLLVTSAQPQLLAPPGVGAISAAQVLISWSPHRPVPLRGGIRRPSPAPRPSTRPPG
jgi:transposase